MITTLTGENRFMIQAEINRAVATFLEKYDELGLERIDGEEASFERIQESILGLPFFTTNKLVIIKGADSNKQFLEHLEHIIDAVPETTDVILVIPKVDKRAKYAKLLQKLTEYKDLTQNDARSLAAWLVQEAKQGAAQLSIADAQYLVSRVGTNQAILQHELEKLILRNPKISRETIEEMTDVLPQSTVFELLDAAFSGNHKKTMALYEEQRQLKVEPLAILGMIAWQLHILAIVATAKGKSPGDIAKEAKVHPFVVNKSAGVLRHLSLTQLKSLIDRTLTLDIRLKSQTIHADDALQHLLLTIN